MPFTGGPKPYYPIVEPVNTNEEETEKQDEISWVDFIRYGGAGDEADSVELQQARYKADVQDTVEVYPSLQKHAFRKADLLITCSHDYTIRSFDCNNNYTQLQLFEGHFGMVNSVCSYRGTQLISVADDCTLRIWQRGTEEYGELLMTFYINKYPIKCVQALPGQRALMGGLDKILRVFSLVSGHMLVQFQGHELEGPNFGTDIENMMQKEGCGAVSCCLYIKENLVASGGDDSTIRFWDIDKGECLGIHTGHPGWGPEIGGTGVGIPFSEKFAGVWRIINLGDGGNHISSCSFDRTITTWDISDITNVKVVKNWLAHSNGIQHLALVGPGVIASCAGDKEMKLWNCMTGECLHKVHIKRGYPFCVQYLDEKLLAMCGGDTTVRIIDWKDGPKDLVGDTGFNAHEYIISDCCAIYYEDEDEKYWTKEPIMYTTIGKEVGNDQAAECIQMHKTILQEGLTDRKSVV